MRMRSAAPNVIFVGFLIVLVQSNHSIWKPDSITCDPQTNICEIFVNTNITFNSSTMEIMFGDEENQYPHAFFDDITVRYLLQGGNDSFLLYDGNLKENINCTCIDEDEQNIEQAVCPSIKGVLSDYKSDLLIEPPEENPLFCPPLNKGICCHSLWIEDVHIFRVFPNLTCKFEDMQFIYKKKSYELTFLQNEIELVDMNMTWLGGEQWTFPTDTFALLEDLDTGEMKFVFSKAINFPLSSNFSKAGWWQGAEFTKTWMSMQKNTTASFIQDLPRIDTIGIQHQDIKGIECEHDEQDQLFNENNISEYNMLVKRTRIMGENGKILDYAPGSIGNVTILISGYPVRICVYYPTICICDSTSEFLQCLDYQGFINIKDYSSNAYKLGYLNNTAVYRTPICSGSDFYLLRTPHNIQINIQSNNLIPRYFMSDCQPQWQHLASQNLSLYCNCTFLPCQIENNLGSKSTINLIEEPQYLQWENNSEWFELTCGNGNSSQKIDRFATVYAPFKTSVTEEEDDSRDWMQSFVFNLLFFGYNSGLSVLLWVGLGGATYFFYYSVGQNFTIVIWCLFLVFYWIGGFMFLLFILGCIFGYSSCMPCLIGMNRARTVVGLVKDVYQAV